jgi:hypothetical protein
VCTGAHHAQISTTATITLCIEWKDGRLLSSGADRKLAVRYHDLLVETMLFCINKLAKTGAYTALMEFSSKVLGSSIDARAHTRTHFLLFLFSSLSSRSLEAVH